LKAPILSLSIKLLLLPISLNCALAFALVRVPMALPITGGVSGASERSAAVVPPLDTFIATIKNGQPEQVVGVYVSEVLALKVVQQSANDPAYVTRTIGYATQFGPAAKYGAIGLLAHNDRSGGLFFNLLAGQEVDIIYGDGAIRHYTISTFRHFQALRPTDPYSNFVDLDLGGQQVLNANLFDQIYGGDRVVFQTCISAYGNRSWGRLFVIATPSRSGSLPSRDVSSTGRRSRWVWEEAPSAGGPE